MRSLLQLVVVMMAEMHLVSAAWAQDGWPGIAIKYGTTGAPGVQQIAYGNGLFLAVGRSGLYTPPGGIAATSPDGLQWAVHTVSNTPLVGWVRGVVAGNSNFVVFGSSETYYGDPAGTNGVIQFSTDGAVWSQPVMINSVPLAGLAYANGTYVAVGQSGGAAAVVTSADGVNWSIRSFPGYGPLNSITSGGSTLVAVGQSGAIITSTNGLDWLTQAVPPGANIYAVAYGNGIFVATAPPLYILTSTNGTDWVVTPSPPVYRIGYGNGLFVGISRDIAVSTDGVGWTQVWHDPRGHTELDSVAYGAGTFNFLVNQASLINIGPSAFLELSAETHGVVDLTLTGGWLGQSCRLQAATNLSGTNWVDLFTFTNQGSVTYLQDTSATNYSQRFYRVAMP